MTTTNPTLLAMPIAKNGTKNTIPATQAAAGDGLLSQSTGFPPETALPLGAGGVAPSREDFNGAFNLLSDIAFYAQKGWIFQWDAGQDYFVGCEVIDSTNGLKYRCIQDVTAGGDKPSEDEAVHWWPVIEGETIGSVKMCLQTSIPDGWLSCENGQVVLRSAYPELWQWVQDNAPLITEAQWQTKAAAQKSVGYYSDGDGSTTFRLPRLVGFMEGTTAANAGKFTAAGLPNIDGATNAVFNNAFLLFSQSGIGALGSSASQPNVLDTWSGSGTTRTANAALTFDASQSNPIYGNSATVQPESVGMVWCVRAFGAATNQGTVDITELAQMLNLKLSISDAPRVCTPFAFPSSTYVNVPITNTTSMTYTAPADGFVTAQMNATTNSRYMLLFTDNLHSYTYQTNETYGAGFGTTLPIRKGETATIATNGATIAMLKFIYAVGEEP